MTLLDPVRPVLVFGQTGQVARALAKHDGVLTLSRAAADLSDPDACADAITAYAPCAVINAAAWTAVDAAETQEAEAQVINADAPGAMARACASRDIPFVHISTDYVFDGAKGRPWRPDDATGPLGAYGRTKRAGEAQVIAAGGRSVILRTSWVFDGSGVNFLTTMLRLSKTRDALSVVADQTGGPTPAHGIAAACMTIATALMNGRGAPGIYHFAGAPDVTWADFARAIFAAAGRDVAVTDMTTADYPTPAVRPANSRLDCSKLSCTFGIHRPDWQAALTDFIKETTT